MTNPARSCAAIALWIGQSLPPYCNHRAPRCRDSIRRFRRRPPIRISGRAKGQQGAFPVRADVVSFGNVNESDDDAVDLVVYGPIGPQPNVKPTAIATPDLPSDRREIHQYTPGILD